MTLFPLLECFYSFHTSVSESAGRPRKSFVLLLLLQEAHNKSCVDNCSVCLFPCSSLWKTPLSAKQTVSMGSHDRPAVNLSNLSAACRWSKFYVVKSSQHPSVTKSCVKFSVCLSSSHPGKFCFLSWKTFSNSQTGNDALLYCRWIPDSEMYLYLLSLVHFIYTILIPKKKSGHV